MKQRSTIDKCQKVRLDKWLWAARWYKTRAISSHAVAGGLVHYNSQRVKPSQSVTVGSEIKLRQGQVERTIIVLALAQRRGSASEASLLYEETAASLVQREQAAMLRRASKIVPGSKPSKQERRQRQKLIGR